MGGAKAGFGYMSLIVTPKERSPKEPSKLVDPVREDSAPHRMFFLIFFPSLHLLIFQNCISPLNLENAHHVFKKCLYNPCNSNKMSIAFKKKNVRTI